MAQALVVAERNSIISRCLSLRVRRPFVVLGCCRTTAPSSSTRRQAATVTASSWGVPISSGRRSTSTRNPAMWTSMASTLLNINPQPCDVDLDGFNGSLLALLDRPATGDAAWQRQDGYEIASALLQLHHDRVGTHRRHPLIEPLGVRLR